MSGPRRSMDEKRLSLIHESAVSGSGRSVRPRSRTMPNSNDYDSSDSEASYQFGSLRGLPPSHPFAKPIPTSMYFSGSTPCLVSPDIIKQPPRALTPSNPPSRTPSDVRPRTPSARPRTPSVRRSETGSSRKSTPSTPMPGMSVVPSATSPQTAPTTPVKPKGSLRTPKPQIHGQAVPIDAPPQSLSPPPRVQRMSPDRVRVTELDEGGGSELLVRENGAVVRSWQSDAPRRRPRPIRPAPRVDSPARAVSPAALEGHPLLFTGFAIPDDERDCVGEMGVRASRDVCQTSVRECSSDASIREASIREASIREASLRGPIREASLRGPIREASLRAASSIRETSASMYETPASIYETPPGAAGLRETPTYIRETSVPERSTSLSLTPTPPASYTSHHRQSPRTIRLKAVGIDEELEGKHAGVHASPRIKSGRWRDRDRDRDHSPVLAPLSPRMPSIRKLKPKESVDLFSVPASAKILSDEPFDLFALPTRERIALAAQCKLLDASGRVVLFGDLLPPSTWNPALPPPRTLVLFVRHYLCGLCQDFVSDVEKRLNVPSLAAANIRLIFIGNGHHRVIRSYQKALNSTVPYYTDPTPKKDLYRLLGMTLAAKFGQPRTPRPEYNSNGPRRQACRGFVNVLKWPLGAPSIVNWRQNGGELLFSPGYTCNFAHRMHHMGDHWDPGFILRTVGVPYPTSVPPPGSSPHAPIDEQLLRAKLAAYTSFHAYYKSKAVINGHPTSPVPREKLEILTVRRPRLSLEELSPPPLSESHSSETDSSGPVSATSLVYHWTWSKARQ